MRFNEHFYGNKISNYGLQHGRVDYATFSKAFDAVLNNTIMSATWNIGEWDIVSGFPNNEDAIEELEARIEELEEILKDISEKMETETDAGKLQELQRDFDGTEIEKNNLEDEKEGLETEEPGEVYQWYIVDENGARICEEFNEILYFNEKLDIYLWGVTHYGTSWDYVLTNIECSKS